MPRGRRRDAAGIRRESYVYQDRLRCSACSLLAIAGCERSESPSYYDLAGLWSLSAQSTDGAVSFKATPIEFVAAGSNGSYTAAWIWPPFSAGTNAVSWLQVTPNGTAKLAADSRAVTINVSSISNAPIVLSLSGILGEPHEMTGTGTIRDNTGVRPANWNAER